VKYKVSTAISSEQLTVSDVKLHLRLTSDTTEDALIAALITAARDYCEKYTGRAFATQTLVAYLDNFPAEDYIELPMPPLQSVTSIKYKNSAGTETTMTVTTQYIADTDSDVGRIVLPYGVSWPSFTPYPFNPIAITYVAGYTTLPRQLRQAMLLVIGSMYENRENDIALIGGQYHQTEFAAKALMDMYKVRWFG
jgi:uncharacterized phiE125 gp8 family phage protein